MNQVPETFELELVILPSDIDELGHVNNITYLRWVQDAAVAHWTARAAAEDQAKLAWVVVRHEIDYKHPAYLEDRLLARTWVGSATRVTFERNTEVLRARDRRVLARARTLWCPINVRTRRPSAVSAEVRAQFSVPGEG